MSDLTTCADTRNVTFSLGSADGPTPLTLPDGRVIDPCGLALALASLSARQVKALGLKTSGIYGPPGSISSRSASLQSFLENRFRANVPTYGSTSYSLTWKAWVTPSRVSRFRLQGSAPRSSGIVRTGWPAPMAGTPAQNGNNEAGNTDSSRKTVALIFGAMEFGACAATGKPAPLSPALYRWSMGYPHAWCDCAVTAMRLFPSKRRRSSKP